MVHSIFMEQALQELSKVQSAPPTLKDYRITIMNASIIKHVVRFYNEGRSIDFIDDRGNLVKALTCEIYVA